MVHAAMARWIRSASALALCLVALALLPGVGTSLWPRTPKARARSRAPADAHAA